MEELCLLAKEIRLLAEELCLLAEEIRLAAMEKEYFKLFYLVNEYE
jgi:hypothetical protein